MKENKIAWLLSYTIIFFLLLIFLSLVLSVRNRVDLNQSIQNNLLELLPGGTIRQQFVAKHDFFNIINLSFKNPGLKSKDNFLITLSSADGMILAQQTISGLNMGDPDSIRFQFAPIYPSKNREFELKIEPLPPFSQEKVSVSIEEPGVSNFSNLSIGGNVHNGVLSFSTYYRTNNKIGVIKDCFAEITKKLDQDPLFFILWTIMVITMFIWGTKTLLKKSS